jgi:outer membrane protein TolC
MSEFHNLKVLVVALAGLPLLSGGALAQASAGATAPSLKQGWQIEGSLSLRVSPERAATTRLAASGLSAAHLRWPQLLEHAAASAAANRAAQAGTQAASALSDQAHASAWMPRVDASAAAQRVRQSSHNERSSLPSASLTVTATQPVWRAADRATSRAQQALASQSTWQARQARMGNAQQLSQAYLQAAEAAEQKRLLLAQQALLEEQLRINERRLRAGAGTVLDILETRTRLDQTRASVQDSDTRLHSLALQVHRLCGQSVAMPRGITALDALAPDVVPEQSEAMSLALARNPQRQDALAQTEAASATLSARNAERWQPTLDATASWAKDRQRDPLDNSNTQRTASTAFGLQLNMPVFTGGYQDGRTREAVALKTQSDAKLDEAELGLRTQLQDDYQTLAQARLSLQVQQQVEASASAAFDAVRKAFVAGMRTNLDLLNAQQQIYAARQNIVGAHIQALSAQVSILAALDQLDGEHIAPLAQLVDDTP